MLPCFNFKDGIFFFCLAVIKKNGIESEVSKFWQERQVEHFEQYISYLKRHYATFLNVAVTLNNIDFVNVICNMTSSEFQINFDQHVDYKNFYEKEVLLTQNVLITCTQQLCIILNKCPEMLKTLSMSNSALQAVSTMSNSRLVSQAPPPAPSPIKRGPSLTDMNKCSKLVINIAPDIFITQGPEPCNDFDIVSYAPDILADEFPNVVFSWAESEHSKDENNLPMTTFPTDPINGNNFNDDFQETDNCTEYCICWLV